MSRELGKAGGDDAMSSAQWSMSAPRDGAANQEKAGKLK
jgi:hypothetical protein